MIACLAVGMARVETHLPISAVRSATGARRPMGERPDADQAVGLNIVEFNTRAPVAVLRRFQFERQPGA